MSDLKYMSPGLLREEIASISKWRATKEAEAALLEAKAEEMKQQAASLRLRAHNMGQRECWARIYLARSADQ